MLYRDNDYSIGSNGCPRPLNTHVDYLKILKCEILPLSIHVVQSAQGGRDGKFLAMSLNINLCQNSMKLKL